MATPFATNLSSQQIKACRKEVGVFEPFLASLGAATGHQLEKRMDMDGSAEYIAFSFF
jgi:hypothetical protein